MQRKVKKPQQRSFEFVIESIDGLGQGVAKRDGKPCFIAKTLPGDTGTAQIFKTSKGVSFASVESLEQTAPNRIEPECEHFASCPGCHFLHTDYASELQYKLAALQRTLRGLPLDAEHIEVLGAPQRLGYRNRVQLHYRHKYIGMLDGSNDQVVEVPHCKIIDPQLQSALDALYQDRQWSKLYSGSGHCELYIKDGEVQTSWNQPYAQGGFTQVNHAMNETLRKQLLNYAAQGPTHSILDLFAGEGNLSQLLVEADASDEAVLPTSLARRTMVDYNPEWQGEERAGFYNLDLFDAKSLTSFARREARDSFDLVIVDPPRKGFPGLADWVQKYKPKQLIYVSCNATTMARDIKNLQGKFAITHASLLDLFPATYHFESMLRIEFKNHKKS